MYKMGMKHGLSIVKRVFRSDGKVLFYGLLFALFLVLYKQGPSLQPDSEGYLAYSAIRSMGYPLFLKAYQAVFGQFFDPLIVLQLSMGFVASLWLSQRICDWFSVTSRTIFALLTVVFLMPYIGYTHIGNAILSEALCYPLFLAWVGTFGESIFHHKSRSVAWSFLWMTLLVLTRRQFLFLYPVVGILLVYWLLKRYQIKKTFTLLGVLLMAIVGTNGIERVYQYVQDGHFETVPFTGISAVNLPLFVSTPESIQYLTDPRQRALFKAVYPKMLKLGLVYNPTVISDHTFDIYIPQLTRFKSSYDLIQWNLVMPALQELGFKNDYENEIWLMDMAKTLMWHQWRPCLELYLKNIISNMGGYYYVFLLMGFLCLLGCRLLQSSVQSTRQQQVLFFLMLAHFANYTSIALVQIAMKRYTLYTDPLQIALLFMVLQAYVGPLSFTFKKKGSHAR
ncbi:MAG: hypothetical protein RLZ35_1264 [Pseudomonadota bacterium]|jgi:hypothetical protein